MSMTVLPAFSGSYLRHFINSDIKLISPQIHLVGYGTEITMERCLQMIIDLTMQQLKVKSRTLYSGG